MKRPFVFFIALLIAEGLIMPQKAIAQSPEKMSYQAVIRNASNNLVTNQPVGMRISILQGSVSGTPVYVEIYNPNPVTNANGLVTVEIGGGIPVSGTFSSIDWSAGPYFLKTETDPGGGTNYTITGTTQLLSVPFALHAKTAETVLGGITETDPLWSASPSSGISSTNISNWNTAFGWGNHSGLYRPVSWAPSWADVTAKPATFPSTEHSHGSITADGKIGTTAGRIVTTGTDGVMHAMAGTEPGQMLYWNGSSWINVAAGNSGQILTLVNGVPTWTGTSASSTDIVNPSTGKIWMDRNLGASRVAASSTDEEAYGDLYQWGRRSDGHQLRTSAITTTLSDGDMPMHGNFILAPNSPWDWRSPQNNNLWQGASGINNPCPSGYRLPTEAELNAERLTWSSNNSAGAFASPLKLPVGGSRSRFNGSITGAGSHGYCWSSTVSGQFSRVLYFMSSDGEMHYSDRANAFAVRCIKD